MKMDRIYTELLDLFPEPLKFAAAVLFQERGNALEELRLRQGQPVSAFCGGREIPIRYRDESLTADAELLQEILRRASGSSVYAVQDQLSRGFLSLPCGHRLGVCGRAVCENGGIRTVTEIQSLNLRVAREIRGAAGEAVNLVWSHPDSTLIAGGPGAGKTTVLRDLIRQLSDRFSERVAVVDERGELAACLDGLPQLSIGRRTDVLTGCPKALGIEMLLRTMRPDWIALDEITAQSDVEAIRAASYCGARFAATVHVRQREDLFQRPVYRRLMESGVFENLVLIRPDRSLVCERLGHG